MAPIRSFRDSKRSVAVQLRDYDPLSYGSSDSDDASAAAYSFDDKATLSKPPKKRGRNPWLKCGAVYGIALTIILLALNLLYGAARWLWGLEHEEPDSALAGWGRPGTGTEDLAWYPTDFLRDVVPKACHSHNDYWRRVPLFSALHAGCIGVEADVWWFDSEGRRDRLYVGHNRAGLQRKRTFETLYVRPLVEILERQNPSTEFYGESWHGVFDTDPSQSLTLLVDVKTDGPLTWPQVVEQLEPLRARGWLSTSENGTVRYGPVTVVGTGNAPFDQIRQNSTYRDVFFDAPLDALGDADYSTENSYYASVSLQRAIGQVWPGGLTPEQLQTIRQQVREAHARGLKVRYWSTPAWPINVRNYIWRVLEEEGVDLLNVDDLKGATQRDWTKVWHARPGRP